jgi:ABC-2 type transport system ATP-binding protein
MSTALHTRGRGRTAAFAFADGPAIEVRDLVKTYSSGRGTPPVRAVDGLDLEVAQGTVLGLLGPNGAGKSTTVKILTTLTRPDSGVARVAGLDTATDPDAVRRVVGLVGQKAGSDPVATGRENLELAARIQGLGRETARRRTEELLARFRLVAAADRPVRTYSGGMARKLDVAIGLVHRPRVLFLDEPTTGLDPEARAETWAEIEAVAADESITVLLTTHYLEEADRLAERVAIVDRGRVVAEGSPDELKRGLRGDSLTVELEAGEGAAAAGTVGLPALVGNLPGVHDVVVEGGTIRARVDEGAQATPALLSILDDAHLAVASVTVARPSLDDVYLRFVGRAFEGGDR